MEWTRPVLEKFYVLTSRVGRTMGNSTIRYIYSHVTRSTTCKTLPKLIQQQQQQQKQTLVYLKSLLGRFFINRRLSLFQKALKLGMVDRSPHFREKFCSENHRKTPAIANETCRIFLRLANWFVVHVRGVLSSSVAMAIATLWTSFYARARMSSVGALIIARGTVVDCW